MKKGILFGTLIFAAVVFQAYAQCNKVHYFCTSQFSKEQQKEYWELDNQSKSAVFSKGKVYEMSFVAYPEYNYRISVCTDIVEGSSEKIAFQLMQDDVVRVKDANGNTNIKKQRVAIYDNADDNNSPFVKFKTEKTRKMYLSVNVPSTGESDNKKLKLADNVCVGVLVEHKKAAKTGF